MIFKLKKGSIYKILIGAILADVVRTKLLGNKEAIDNDNFDFSFEENKFNYSSYKDEFFNVKDDEDCEYNGMILEGQYDNHTPEKIAARAEVVEHQHEHEEQDIIFEETEESRTHIEIDCSQNKVFLRDEQNNILAENEFPGLRSNGMEQYESLKSLYPDGNVPKDVKITYIMSTEERRLQDKLNEMHITELTAKDILHSSDPIALLRTYGVPKESVDI